MPIALASSLLPCLSHCTLVTMSSVPLVCMICPKRPKFSDISHLLTHVGSKGHLSHHSKAQWRSNYDNAVLQQLQEYDLWYENNQIERLLAQRMASKDAKATSARMRPSSISSARTIRRRGSSEGHAAVIPDGPPRKHDVTTLIDPRIADIGQSIDVRSMKSDNLGSKNLDHPAEFIHSPSPIYTDDQMPSLLTHNSYDQQLRGGSVSSSTREESQPTPNSGFPNIHGHQRTLDDVFAADDSSPDRTQHDKHGTRSFKGHRDRGQPYVKEEELDPNPMIKLKGPQWPGMALFDSASPRTQRKRNQKKEVTVLGQMEQDSLEIEQVEKIYFPDGSLKKERVITGVVESSSPAKTQSPKPKRRRGRRAPLAEVDSNVSRMPRATNRAKSTKKVHDRRSTDWAGKSVPHHLTSSRRKDFEDDGYGASKDTEAEWASNQGVSEYPGRRRLNIFHDDVPSPPLHGVAERDRTSENAHSSAEAASADFPGYDFSTGALSPLIPKSVSQPSDTARHSTFTEHLYGAISVQDAREEAIAPMLSLKRCDNATANPIDTRRVTQRYFSLPFNGEPQFFHHKPAELDLGPFELSMCDGQTINPLNRGMLQQQNPFYQGFPALQARHGDGYDEPRRGT